MGTYRVVAAVHVQVRGRRDTADKPENGVQDVEHQRDDGMEGQGLLDARRQEVEEGEHAEDGAEKIVVDHGAAAAGRDEVAGERHDQDRPEELRAECQRLFGFSRGAVATYGQTAHGGVDDVGCTHCDGVAVRSGALLKDSSWSCSQACR